MMKLAGSVEWIALVGVLALTGCAGHWQAAGEADAKSGSRTIEGTAGAHCQDTDGAARAHLEAWEPHQGPTATETWTDIRGPCRTTSWFLGSGATFAIRVFPASTAGLERGPNGEGVDGR